MDGDPDAEFAQTLQARSDAFAVLEEQAFGDFDFEAAGGEAVAREGARDGVGQVGVVEIVA